jgi:site-specific DNA recombinase
VVAELKDPARLTVTSFEKKWVGSGVYLCGVCGSTMAVSWPGRNQGRKYACPAHSCVMRAGQPLDDYVENAVLERLSQPDAHLLIAKRGIDVADLQDQRAGWVAKLDLLVELLDDGTLDGPKAREKAAGYKDHIARIDATLAQAARTSPTAALLATGKELRQRWEKLTPAIRGEIIGEIAVVKINPAARGERGFNPDYIDLTWK